MTSRGLEPRADLDHQLASIENPFSISSVHIEVSFPTLKEYRPGCDRRRYRVAGRKQRIWYTPCLRHDDVEKGAVLVAKARQSNSDNHGGDCERYSR